MSVPLYVFMACIGDNFTVSRGDREKVQGNLVIVPFPSELWNMLQENVCWGRCVDGGVYG